MARSSSESLSQAEGALAPGPFRTVIWFEGGFAYRLGFGPHVAEADAMALADQLAVVDAAAWRDLVYPETLDTDLLPMPTDVFVVALGVDRPVATGGLAPTSTTRPRPHLDQLTTSTTPTSH